MENNVFHDLLTLGLCLILFSLVNFEMLFDELPMQRACFFSDTFAHVL